MHSSPTERHSAYFSSRVSLRFEKEKRGQSAERDVGAWATRRARRGGRRSGGGSNGAKDEARSARRARHARAVRLDPGRSMVPAPAGLRDRRRRVGARRHARARSRNRVGSRATHPLSTGGATPNAPASAVTTSFFSSSTFICSISAAAASAIFALEVRSARCVGGFGEKRRAAERKMMCPKKPHTRGRAIVLVFLPSLSVTVRLRRFRSSRLRVSVWENAIFRSSRNPPLKPKYH